MKNPPKPWLWTLLVAVAGIALTVSRRPDAVFHAQFWAEDGNRWYANSYTWGWQTAMVTSAGGYFQTLSRITAALSVAVGLHNAPLLSNLIALVFQVLPAIFIVTPRLSRAIPDFRIRVLLAFLYIGLPNSFELHVNITNAMTHLAILAFLVIIAEPSKHWGWRVFDLFVLVLSGLSGPFVIALIPVAALRWLTDRGQRWRLVVLLAVLTCAAIEAVSVLTSSGPGSRPHAPLGASVHGFMAIVTGNVFAGALIGLTRYTHLYILSGWDPHSVALRLAFLGGMAVFAYAVVRGTLELRLLILFSWILLIAALLTPVVSLSYPQWPLMGQPGVGNRYFEIPMLAFLASVVWMMAKSTTMALRLAGAGMVAVTVFVGMPRDWVYPPLSNLDPEGYAQAFDRAAPGTHVVIPINPPGWTIELTK